MDAIAESLRNRILRVTAQYIDTPNHELFRGFLGIDMQDHVQNLELTRVMTTFIESTRNDATKLMHDLGPQSEGAAFAGSLFLDALELGALLAYDHLIGKGKVS